MSTTARPSRISVLLPVHNGEQYTGEAVRSVLGQTFTDFELLVIDDGSTDRTPEILAGFADPRLRVIRLPENAGLVAALNLGILESQSEFVARMDADDISLPRRFERQVAFLDSHPTVAVCGTWIREFGVRRHAHRLPVQPDQIRARLFFRWAMAHPTLMMRRGFLESHAIRYSAEFPHTEDLELLLRAADLTNLANIPEILLLYRAHVQQASYLHARDQLESRAVLSVRQLRLLVPEVTAEDKDFHRRLILGESDASSLDRAEAWLLRLDQANLNTGRYDEHHFRRGLREWWHSIHHHASAGGLNVLSSYWRSPLASIRDLSFRNHAGLIARCLR